MSMYLRENEKKRNDKKYFLRSYLWIAQNTNRFTNNKLVSCIRYNA